MKTYEIDRVPITDKRMSRDMSSKALLNNDLAALQAYKDKKRQMEETMNQKDEINKLHAAVDDLQSNMHDIKSLLTALLEKR